MCKEVWWGNFENRDHLGDLDFDGRRTNKWILKT
jgi:hypothetical protein